MLKALLDQLTALKVQQQELNAKLTTVVGNTSADSIASLKSDLDKEGDARKEECQKLRDEQTKGQHAADVTQHKLANITWTFSFVMVATGLAGYFNYRDVVRQEDLKKEVRAEVVAAFRAEKDDLELDRYRIKVQLLEQRTHEVTVALYGLMRHLQGRSGFSDHKLRELRDLRHTLDDLRLSVEDSAYANTRVGTGGLPGKANRILADERRNLENIKIVVDALCDMEDKRLGKSTGTEAFEKLALYLDDISRGGEMLDSVAHTVMAVSYYRQDRGAKVSPECLKHAKLASGDAYPTGIALGLLGVSEAYEAMRLAKLPEGARSDEQRYSLGGLVQSSLKCFRDSASHDGTMESLVRLYNNSAYTLTRMYWAYLESEGKGGEIKQWTGFDAQDLKAEVENNLRLAKDTSLTPISRANVSRSAAEWLCVKARSEENTVADRDRWLDDAEKLFKIAIDGGVVLKQRDKSAAEIVDTWKQDCPEVTYFTKHREGKLQAMLEAWKQNMNSQ